MERDRESPFKPKNAYLRMFQGERVFLSEIIDQSPFVKPAIDSLMEDGKIIGQEILGEKPDMLLWMPDRIKK